MDELSNYPNLYPEEGELLHYVLRIFGEFSRTPKVAEYNITNGLLNTCVKILTDDTQKFNKEIRMQALSVINKGCQHQLSEINTKTLQVCLNYLSPSFLKFLLGITDPLDTDFTANCKMIFVQLEALSAAKDLKLI